MGYELKEGFYNKKILSNDEMWKAINWLFSVHSKNESSYKFLFFKALIDSFGENDSEYKVSFCKIFERFTEISWNIVVKYRVRQKTTTIDGKKCLLEERLYEFHRMKLQGNYVDWNQLDVQGRTNLCKQVKNTCKKYVVGALFSDMNGLLYSFNKKEEWIEFNPIMVQFINKNRDVIENLNYYKWSKFYEKVNGFEVNEYLQTLIDNGFKRKSESIYRAMLAFEFERSIQTERTESSINTLEILLHAENLVGNKDLVVIENEYEEVMYDSYEDMREYLKDPILLINTMKKKCFENRV